MQTPRHTKRKLAGWALVAGSLGLAGPAAAQTPPARPAAPPAVRGEAARGADAQTRLEAIQVELAWLTDPATFPYNLTIYPSGAFFDVRGYVPDDAVRSRVMVLAGSYTSRPVIDSLQVQRSMAGRPTAGNPEALQQAGAETLSKWGRTLTVRARPGGQLVLSGTASSHEEKLALSRRLRALPGCTSVANELTVAASLRDGKLYHLVTADGKYRVPAHAGILHVSHTTSSPAAAQPSGSPTTLRSANHQEPALAEERIPPPTPVAGPDLSMPGLPAERPASLSATSLQSARELPMLPAVPPAPAAPALAAGPADSGPRLVTVKVAEGTPGSLTPMQREIPVLLSGTDRRQPTRLLSPQEAAALQKADQAPPMRQPVAPAPAQPIARDRLIAAPQRPAPAPRPPAPPIRGLVASPPAAPRPSLAPTPTSPAPTIRQTTTVPQPPMPRPRIENTPAPRPASDAAIHQTGNLAPPPLSPSTTNRPSKPAAPPTASPISNLPSLGKVVSAPAAPKTTVPPPRTTPPAPSRLVMPKAPYVASGVMLVEGEEIVPKVAPARLAATELKTRIEKACGGRARDVLVTYRPDGAVGIRVRVANAAQADELSTRILSMPELIPHEVRLDVQLAQ